MADKYKMFIGGKKFDSISGEYFDVINHATEEKIDPGLFFWELSKYEIYHSFQENNESMTEITGVTRY